MLATNVVLIISKTLTNRPWLQRRNSRPRKRGRSPEPKPMTYPEYDREKRKATEEMLKLAYFQAEISALRKVGSTKRDGPSTSIR